MAQCLQIYDGRLVQFESLEEERTVIKWLQTAEVFSVDHQSTNGAVLWVDGRANQSYAGQLSETFHYIKSTNILI